MPVERRSGDGCLGEGGRVNAKEVIEKGDWSNKTKPKTNSVLEGEDAGIFLPAHSFGMPVFEDDVSLAGQNEGKMKN